MLQRSARVLLALLMVASPATLKAAEVTVMLLNGRHLTGEVDTRSGDRSLWLRVVEPSIVFRQEFPWHEINQVQIGDRVLGPEQLQAELDTLATDLSNHHFEEQPLQVRDAPPLASRAETLEISARAGNWDRDAELDGLELTVTALDAQRRPLPIRGHLLVTLVGRDNMPVSRADVFPTWQRWSVRHAAEATHRLPFLGFHPEMNPRVSTHGTLRVMLVAEGHGSFTSETPVFLRTFNPIKSQMLFDLR